MHGHVVDRPTALLPPSSCSGSGFKCRALETFALMSVHCPIDAHHALSHIEGVPALVQVLGHGSKDPHRCAPQVRAQQKSHRDAEVQLHAFVCCTRQADEVRVAGDYTLLFFLALSTPTARDIFPLAFRCTPQLNASKPSTAID